MIKSPRIFHATHAAVTTSGKSLSEGLWEILGIYVAPPSKTSTAYTYRLTQRHSSRSIMKDIKTDTINTTKQIGDLVDRLVFYHAPPTPTSPTMYIDLEGVDLCREGSISILTILVNTEHPKGLPHRCACARCTSFQYHRCQPKEDAERYP